MRQPLQFALLAGATLLVAACGGGATNNTANTTDNGTIVSNEPTMAPDNMSAGMPADNNAMAAPAPAPVDNGAAPAGNTANHM